MTINSKQVISQQELNFQFSQCGSHGDDFSLGLLTIYNTVHPTGLHHSYSFLHLTFQEFLAAYHIANLTSSQQMKIIQQYSESTHMITVWTFYYGLGLFGSKMVTKMINNAKTVTVLRYGLESQQQVVCDKIMKQKMGSLGCNDILTPTDLQAIGYVIATTSEPITTLTLGDCHYDGEDRFTILLEELSNKDLHTLNRLEIISYIISGIEMNMLVNVLKSATNLVDLELKIKDSSPDDVKCLVDQIKQISIVGWLTLRCSSPVSSIKVLLSGLRGIAPDISLWLLFEEVDAEGVLALGSGLELHTNTNITRLNLTNSSICLEGATALANGLRHLTKLSTLHLSHNNIGCQCFSTLCNGLQYLTSLLDLDLSHNDITCGHKFFRPHTATSYKVEKLGSVS